MAGPIVDADDVALLALGMLLGAGAEGVPEEHVRQVAAWAVGVRLMYALLLMALDGEVFLRWTGDDVCAKKTSAEERRAFLDKAAACGILPRA